MQTEAIKYQPPVEDVVVTQEEKKQILKLGRIAGEQLRIRAIRMCGCSAGCLR